MMAGSCWSVQGLAPALVGAPEQNQQRPAQVPVLLQMLFLVQESDPLMGASQTQWRELSLVAFSDEVLQHLWLHPQDLLLGWSWLWEWWWTSGHVLVVDWLSLSMHSFSTVAAARSLWWLPWPWWVLTLLKCPTFLSGKLSYNGKRDGCWQALVLHLLLMAPLSSALGGLSRKTKCSLLSIMLFLVHTVGVWAIS